MDLKIKDLELLTNDQNKKLYSSMYDIILAQFEDALRFTDIANLTENRKKILGTCGIYLSSLVELLHTLRDLIDKGYLESGGAVATACWERALTLRKILIEPELNAQIHTDHQKAKKTPWSIYNMVCDVLTNERKIKNIGSKRPYEEQIFYLQYTFLSTVKHGNPYTISYLYRPGYSSDEKLFRLKSNDSFEDKDLRIYIKMVVVDNALDALIDYSKEFRTDHKILKDLRAQFDGLINEVELQVPSVFLTTPEEMGQDYWDHLVELEKRRKF
jgi:hypothetical protein